MTHGSAAEPEEAPWIRNPNFRDWVNRVIAELGDSKGLTIGQIAERGGISRQQFNRWRGIGGRQSIPEPESVVKFCVGNGLDLIEPFRILGWLGDNVQLPAVDATVRDALVAVADVLGDDAIDQAEVHEVLDQLQFLVAQLRARAERRRRDDAHVVGE